MERSGSKQSGIELTFIVATRNRVHALKEALPRFESMSSARRWELVLVDNGSTDETPTAIREFTVSSTCSVKSVREERPGVSRARNAGLKASEGSIVCFTDDDCYPDPDLPVRILEVFDANQALGFLGGRVLLWDPEDLPITIQVSEERTRFPEGSFIVPGVIHGANMSVRRDLLIEVGGFDERLGPGSLVPAGEDCDLVSAISAAGYQGIYEPSAVVYHHHRRRSAEEGRRLLSQYDLGRGAYYVKCLLDSRRRGGAARQWYWQARAAVSALPSDRSRLASLVREVHGASKYLLSRAFGGR